MFEKFSFRFVATLVVVAMLATTSQAVDIETVPVGDAGNANDTHGDGYGGVDYSYRIGKYEVSNAQYTEFLNAVADTDAYGLYALEMLSSDYGCKIERSGESGSYTYSVAADRENRPVNYVSWGDAARFANWLHNGQPSGVQDNSTTEDGAYYLNGANDDTALMAITRESDAKWAIPTEDEWYKAAYYDGDASVYYDYPTGTDVDPSNVLSNPDPDPGNNANFPDNGYTIGSPYWTTEVGDFENSASPYGTFDQGGNVYEWNEAIVVVDSSRGVRGGSFGNGVGPLQASERAIGYGYPTRDSETWGFRVAMVPEPSTIILLLTGALGFLLYRRR